MRRLAFALVFALVLPFLLGTSADDACQAGYPELVVTATVLEVRDRTDADPPSGAVHDAAARRVRGRIERIEFGSYGEREITFDQDDHLGRRDVIVGATQEFRLGRIHTLWESGIRIGPWVAFSCYVASPPARGGCASSGGR